MLLSLTGRIITIVPVVGISPAVVRVSIAVTVPV